MAVKNDNMPNLGHIVLYMQLCYNNSLFTWEGHNIT